MSALVDLTAAYARQRRVAAERRPPGEPAGRVAGYKIGLSNVAGRAALGAAEPVHGVLLEGALLEDGATLVAADFADLMIEPELALIVGEPSVRGPGVEARIAAVAPALEIVDNRLGDGVPALDDLVASNVAAFGAVLGPAHRGRPAELLGAASCRFGFEGELGDPVGVGALDPLPLKSFGWLIESLAARDEALEAGQFVLTGTLAWPLRPRAGEAVVADFGPLGKLGVRVI